MKLEVLLDNELLRSDSDALETEHGLSYYIETGKHKILFDMGETDLFSKNAKKLGIDLKACDIAFISHAHDDHGGGFEEFLRLNDKTKIYMNSEAFSLTYANEEDGMTYIGLDQELKDNGRIVFTGKHDVIDEELEIFAVPAGEEFMPTSNSKLYVEKFDVGKGGERVQDDFAHEQNLIISDGGKLILIAGCAHRGILNIIEEVKTLKGAYPDVVIGGFHLGATGSTSKDSPERIKDLAQRLKDIPAKYYTGHCTGLYGYEMLKEILGEQVEYIGVGDKVSTAIAEE